LDLAFAIIRISEGLISVEEFDQNTKLPSSDHNIISSV